MTFSCAMSGTCKLSGFSQMKYAGNIVVIIVAALLFGCKPIDIILHGDITGVVTDAVTALPIRDASVKINNLNDSTGTGDDGSFLLKNLLPGEYEVQASKYTYAVSKQIVAVASAETNNVDFPLNGIPVPTASVTYLDFGLDSISLRFSVSNSGKGNFAYFLTPGKSWITISPPNGNITTGTDDIIVTINKSGLSENIYNETITIFSFTGLVPLPEIIIPVSLNGVRDHDGNYYKVVRIGSQIWMAQNINVGTAIPVDKISSNNGIIEKHCYSDSKTNCDIYGGLYNWDEMMQYNPADSGLIGTTQGICPVGWHIPTQKEWSALAENVGGVDVAGAHLKEAGFSHWLAPNLGATNESGFTALSGGGYFPPDFGAYQYIGNSGSWWTATEYYLKTNAYFQKVGYDAEQLFPIIGLKEWGYSVRCVKNPGK
jgi:uncharacterized protein (TIGR02145 family)